MSGKNTLTFEAVADRLRDAGLELHLVAARADVKEGDVLQWHILDPDGALDLRSQLQRLQDFTGSSEFSRIVEIHSAATVIQEQNVSHLDEMTRRAREIQRNKVRLAGLDLERRALSLGEKLSDFEEVEVDLDAVNPPEAASAPFSWPALEPAQTTSG